MSNCTIKEVQYRFLHDLNMYKMASVSTLENFVSYMHNVAEKVPTTILDEIKRVVYYKPQCRPTYSPDVLRFPLMEKGTPQDRHLNEFPLPSLSLLKKLSSGGIDSVKTIQLLLKEEKVSADYVLMLDEMYLQTSTEYQSGSNIGQYANGEFYTGKLAFMIVGLKIYPKACPEVSINGEMAKQEIEESLQTLKAARFNVRAIITDNHSTNVSGYSKLSEKYGIDDDFVIYYEGSNLMYDSVHLIKNVRNNLLNSKTLCFPCIQL